MQTEQIKHHFIKPHNVWITPQHNKQSSTTSMAGE